MRLFAATYVIFRGRFTYLSIFPYTKIMLILITNDDGYQSKGIAKITEIACRYGDVVVIAPDKGYSGFSHAITMHEPLFIVPVEERAGLVRYKCSGSPVDCVKLALDKLMEQRKPDLIISGINHGSNSNMSVIYSGTMGAASEGLLYGIPSIGFSLTDHDPDADFAAFDDYAPQIIEMVLAMPSKKGICLNVNVPNIPQEQIRGIRYCRQTQGVWREDFVHRTDPHGRDYYWMRGMFYNAEPHSEETDEWALANGYVAVVPVQMDLTDYKLLSYLRQQ